MANRPLVHALPRLTELGSDRVLGTILVPGAVVLTGAQLAGLRPVFALAWIMALSLVIVARRVGVGIAIAAIAVGWPSIVFATFTLGPALPIDVRWLNTLVLLAAAGGVTFLARRTDAVYALGKRELQFIAAALTGGVAWVVGSAIGLMHSRGGGLSWSMYRDSTMDLWEMRRFVLYNGIGSVSEMFNVQPLSHGLSSSLVNPTVEVGATPHSVSAFLYGHADHWSLALILGSMGAAALVYRLVAGTQPTTPRHHVVGVTVAALVSFGLTLQPIAGVAMDLGHINAPLNLMLIFAVAAATLNRHNHPGITTAIAFTAAGLMGATWMPFVPVFALLTVLCFVPLVRSARSRDEWLAWILPGFAVSLWVTVIYLWPSIRGIFSRGNDYVVAAAAPTTWSNPGYWESYTSPYSWTLFLVVTVSALIGAFILWRRAARDAWAILALLVSTAGVVWWWWQALPDKSVPLDYFPAKHLWHVTIILGVLALAAFGNALLAGRSWAALGGIGLSALLVVALLAPVPVGIGRLTPTPLLVATGAHFGTHQEVAGRLVNWADEDVLKLPWRLDDAADPTVALMASSISPQRETRDVLNPRNILRNWRGQFTADVACRLADAETRAVVLVTADPALAGEIQSECPAAGISVTTLND